MNTLTALSVTQANEETYNKLLVSLEAGLGMLQIFIAVCDNDRQREEIITNYERELTPTVHTYRVYLDPQEPSLRLAISQQVTVRENAIATVTGTEGLSERGESLEKFFGYLQWTREGLREFKMPIVLWIPARIFAQLAKQAPDFYSWRNGIFQFQPEYSLVTKLSWEQVKQVADQLICDLTGEHLTNIEIFVLQSFLEGLTYDAMAEMHPWGKGYFSQDFFRKVGCNLLNKLSKALGEEITKRNFENAFNRRIESITNDSSSVFTNDSSSLLFSVEQLESSLAKGIKQWGENSPNLEPLYSQLGSLYATRVQSRESEDREREYALAQDYLQKAIALQTQFKQQESLARSLYNLASVYHYHREYEKAEALYQQALEINRAGENHAEIANVLNSLGLLHWNKNEMAIAEQEYQEALEMRRKLAEENPRSFLSKVADTLNNLAILHKNKNEMVIALAEYQEALQITRELAVENPRSFLPNVAMILNNLGLLHYAKNEMVIAEQEYQEALQIYRELAVENPRSFLPDVAITLNNLAVLHSDKNERLIAEQEYQEALQIRRELAVENPRSFLPDVAMTLNNLAILHQRKHEMVIAEQEYQEALQIRRELAVENPRFFLPDVAVTLLNLSIFYLFYLEVEPETSITLAQEVMEIAQQFPDLPTVQRYAEVARRILKNLER